MRIMDSQRHVDAAWIHDNLYSFNVKRSGCKRQEVKLPENPELNTILFCSDEKEQLPAGGLVWKIRKEERVLFVEFLWVGEKARGTGAGEILFQSAVEKAKKLKCVAVETMTNSFQAPQFYLKMGMKVIDKFYNPVPNYPYNEHYHFRLDLVADNVCLCENKERNA